MGRIAIALVATMLLVACQLTLGANPKDQAWQACQRAASEKLKAPATARYPATSEVEVISNPDDAHFGFRGFVDSQNSFGALIRSTFTCGVVKESGGWEVRTMLFDQ